MPASTTLARPPARAAHSGLRRALAFVATVATLTLAACGGGTDPAAREDAQATGTAVATITSPAVGATYKAGDTLTIRVAGTSSTGTALPASSLSWWIDQHHDTHTHPFQLPTTGTGGTATVPTRNETSSNIFLRLHLRVTDTTGATVETTRDIQPLKANVTLATQPAGLGVTLDGTPVTTPLTFTGIVGVERDLAAPEQVSGGRRWRFLSWNHSFSDTNTIFTPATATTYTANYADNGPSTNALPTVSVTAPAAVSVGQTVTLSATAADADGSVAKVEFYDGTTLVGTDTTAPYSVAWSPTAAGPHTITARATDNIGAIARSAAVLSSVAGPVTGGLKATYFANNTLTGTPAITRLEPVNLALTGTATPGAGIPADGWTARWTGWIQLPETGTFVFQLIADDGVRVTFNGAPVLDKWSAGPTAFYEQTLVGGSAGNRYPVTIEYNDISADTAVKLSWKTPSLPTTFALVPAAQLLSTANTAPAVVVSAPAAALVGTPITLQATASDPDGTIARVEFYDNGVLLGSDLTAPYSLAWTPLSSGTRAITALAYDNEGAATRSAAIGVAVNALPTVTLTAPSSATVGVPATLSATASDADGAIARVEFYDGSTLLGSDTSAPYSLAWTPTASGTRSITALAIDDAGASRRSAAASVSVAGAVATTGGLAATYFANTNLSGTPVISRTEVVDFVWTGTTTPGAGIPADGWSVRWTGSVKLPDAGNYIFEVVADDGARIWINGQQIANKWASGPNVYYTTPAITAAAGASIPVTIEHFDASGDSTVRLRWKTPAASVYWNVVPSTQLLSSTTPPPANKAPSVSLAAVASATVGLPVTLSATAADTDGSIAKVEFLDGTTLIGTDTTSPYSVAWTPSAAGSRSLTARATDNGGAQTTSAAVAVNVNPAAGTDVTPPTVVLTAPANRANNLDGTVAITATASDNVGVASVEFQVDGVTVATDTTAPYAASFNAVNYATGQHVVSARSRDAAGNVSAWAKALVNVNGAIFRNVSAGFTRNESWVTGLGAATAFTQAPDGRIFVALQSGQLVVVKNGVKLATPFLTVPTDTSGERGLLGVTLHPNFATNGWVYIYYTAINGAARNNRISRFVASGDVSTGVETVLVNLPNLNALNHNGGAMHFGPDGKLYVAVGDNTTGTKAQDLNDPFGKMLRFNDNGTIPTDNPFCTTPGQLSCAVWAYGLRNPFTFAFQPGTSRMHINDVGQATWEEINVGTRGANYGWPISEGPDRLAAGMTAPLFVYPHADPVPLGSGPGGFFTGAAVVGGTFYPSTGIFPANYRGKYLFADYVFRWVGVLDPTDPGSPFMLANLGGFPVDLMAGQDGQVYVLTRDTIIKISFP